MPNRQTRTSLRWQGIHLPLLIIEEPRSDARVSIGKTTAFLRLPYTAPREFKQEKFIWAKKWILETLNDKPALAQRWKPKEYRTGQIIRTAFKNYTLHLSTNDSKLTGKAVVEDQKLILQLPKLGANDYYTRDFVSSLISKGIALDLREDFVQRVHAINRQFYRESIEGVRLKFVHSRWGSCSNNRALNYSTKILLAPPHIMDHIIIHELAHLKEMNHGPRFWRWVEKADPNWEKHREWLRKYGDKLDF